MSYVCIFIAIALFSTLETGVKLVAGEMDVILLALLRFLTSGIILTVVAAKRFREASRRDLLVMAAMGVTAVGGGFAAYHESLERIDASVAAVVFSVNPVFSALTALIVLGEKLTVRRGLGVALGFVGVYVVSFGFGAVDVDNLAGPALMLFAAFAFGVYIVLAKPYVRRYGPCFVNGVIFLAGSALFPFLVGDWTVRGGTQTWMLVAYLCLAATAAAYVLYFHGLSDAPVAAGTSIFYVKPVLATLLAMAVLDESPKAHFVVGLVIVFASLTLTIFGGRLRKATPLPPSSDAPLDGEDPPISNRQE